jgi:hypothetical protein
VVGGEPAGVWPRGVDTRSRRSEGKEFAAHPGWLAGRGLRHGAMAMDHDDAPGVAAGVLGSFPLGNPRCWLTGAAGARRVCQPADWSSHRPRARVRRDARRYGVVRCWGKGEEEDVVHTWIFCPKAHIRITQQPHSPPVDSPAAMPERDDQLLHSPTARAERA